MDKRKKVLYVSDLAKIKLSEVEIEKYIKEFDDVVPFIEKVLDYKSNINEIYQTEIKNQYFNDFDTCSNEDIKVALNMESEYLEVERFTND